MDLLFDEQEIGALGDKVVDIRNNLLKKTGKKKVEINIS